MRNDYENFLKRVKELKKVKIFGAGKLAKTLCYLFRKNQVEVEAFIVTDLKENAQELLGIPIWNMGDVADSDLRNIVIGVENKDIIRGILNILLKKNVEHIISVNQNILDDIYCNFMIDEDTLANFCEQLKTEKKIITYVNDGVGKVVTDFFSLNNVSVSAVCTDNPKLFKNSRITVLSFEELIKYDNDVAIVITKNSVAEQRKYITKLRNSGFEKTILMSKEILEEIKVKQLKALWENAKTEYKVIENTNVETMHYIVQRVYENNVYRWRVPLDFRFDFDEIKNLAKENILVEECHQQYPGCRYLSYKEEEMRKLTNQGYNLEVYMAKFYKDKPILQEAMPDWVIPIQVGKALTDIQVAEVCDNVGDHISEKNVDYSEGTALYWMWKNTKGQDYIGLFHYRRQMAMDENSLREMLRYDVTLTLPVYMPLGIKEFFCDSFLLEKDWELMIRFIKEYDEEYYKTALNYENGHFYFPCNIFIMKRALFDDMCFFIFGVLEKVDEFYKNIYMVRKDRYLGYLVENLVSIYIMHNVNKLKIAYTDMKYECSLNDN